ncbi:MAG: TIGR03986 family CRISPR-associated RAMP protein [Acidobacteriota bacterium]
MTFHNPYHFVPVEESSGFEDLYREDFENGKVGQVTHDRYYDNTHSGRIICRLIAETPFIVGGKQCTEQTPTKVFQYELDDKPAIPASTLRGLLSSITEAASNSALRVLSNKVFSYRTAARDALRGIGMVVQAGATGNFKLLPLCNFSQRLPTGCLKVKLSSPQNFTTFSFENQQYYYMKKDERHGTTVQPIAEEVWDQMPQSQKGTYERGILRIMENANRKKDFHELRRKHELFIYLPKNKTNFDDLSGLGILDILPEAVECFESLAELRTDEDEQLPYEPVGTKRNNGNEDKNLKLKHGDLVYFRSETINQHQVVVEVAYSCIWRKRVEAETTKRAETTFNFFEAIDSDILPFNQKRELITLAEQIFGFVENNEHLKNKKKVKEELSLAGCVYPSPARFAGIKNESGWQSIKSYEDFYVQNIEDPEGWTILKTLGSPKPPSPAMYFKNADGTGGYIAKDKLEPIIRNKEENPIGGHSPQGRKFYLHHNSSGSQNWKSKNLDPQTFKLKMQAMPVKENSVFYFHLDFDNLNDDELGALLYALRPTKEFRHKLGLGKPIGLGRIRIEPLGLFLVDRSKRYKSENLFTPRYARSWKAIKNPNVYPWIEDAVDFSELPDRYRREKTTIGTPDLILPGSLHENFREKIEPPIRNALELIGDPSKVTQAVHYPTVQPQNGNDEEDSYQWFVANDTGSGSGQNKIKAGEHYNRDYLKPLADEQILTTLIEHPWKK